MNEDPGTIKAGYERGLKLLNNQDGIKQFKDTSGNIIVVLNGKLEDWILSVCKKESIDITHFSLPANSSELHEKIHLRLSNSERLIQELIHKKSRSIQSLIEFLK